MHPGGRPPIKQIAMREDETRAERALLDDDCAHHGGGSSVRDARQLTRWTSFCRGQKASRLPSASLALPLTATPAARLVILRRGCTSAAARRP
jgi:hypothetical protein